MKDKRASIRFIEKCYKLYEQKMYQVANSILRDSGLAEDAVQEAFIKLMKSGTCFENPESEDCKRYVITVIKHSAINIYNKKRREQEI
ncbi:MAG: sigma-70 family RNA polymerase sigma factor, partial [Lachnospiraceae bacterium]|nr:sigma-70 family RNA polymerase sigma factor [Lachnospiraceae bacterium]